MSRRDLLRRGAIVGGTLAWAAPAVQVLAPKAFAQGTPVGGQNVSYLAFITYNDGSGKFKFEDKSGSCKLESGGKLSTDCRNEFPDKHAEFEAASPGNPDTVTVNCTDPAVWHIIPASGYGVVWAIVKSGADNPCSLFQGPFPKGQTVTVYQKT